VVISGNKRDVAEVNESLQKIEAKALGQPRGLATATPGRGATAKPLATKEREDSGVSALGRQSTSNLAAGTATRLRSMSPRAPRFGKDPQMQAELDFAAPIPEGRGPGIPGDQFEPITDNAFKRVSEEALSTFSVDVDTASYSKTRDFLLRAGQLPRPDAVRIEELINYFDYDYMPPKPDAKHPFATHVEVTDCPWNSDHLLARIGLKGKAMTAEERPPCNLVFLLDTSGSMNAANKLPLVIEGMQMLIDQLTEKDQVAITVYAGSAGLVLDSTSAKKSKKIRKALTQLSAGGSTNGGAGIALAYQTARDNFMTEGVNRVILCTDGDFNVGVTGTDALVRMVEQEAKGGIFLSVLGFGMGNHNDAMLEKVSGRGNGNYAFIDTKNEAHKVLVDQTSGTLVTIAKDVKLQLEFNPKHVAQYRLIGYENRMLAKEDFNDDKKDAGEIGAGHAVTALYELVPAGKEADASQPEVDDLKYQTEHKPTEAADRDELMTLKLRYKQPDGDTSTRVEIPVANRSVDFQKASDDIRFAAAVASFGMQLRRSEYAGNWTLSDVEQVAKSAKGEDDYELRTEFLQLVRAASQLMGEE
jgi:Ca-activated chloride channel family protein